MGKKLNVSAVNSAAKKINHRKMFHLTDNQGEIWDVEIDVNMSPENVIKMVQNVVMMSVKITEEKIDYFEFDKHWMMLYFIEILKQYTSIGIKESKVAKENLDAYFELFNSLTSLGLVEAITECFDKEARQNTLVRFSEILQDVSEYVTTEINNTKAERETKTLEVVE